MKIPITQSKEWHKLQEDLGEVDFFEKGNNYQFLAILKKTKFNNYLYLPYGPIAKDREAFHNALKNLKALAKKHHCDFIRIEPFDEKFQNYLPNNVKKSHNLNPELTWILDLNGQDESVNKKLPSRLLRYHKKMAANHLEIIKSKDPEDIDHLLKLQRELASKKGINTFSKQYLKTELMQPFSTLYLMKYTNPENSHSEIVAAGLVFDDKDTRYNLQGAQSDLGRKLHATGILTIQLILDAKAKNLKYFDFWGIAPEGAPSTHPWAGFTNFKKMFDGETLKHTGTYDIVLNPVRYKVYKILRRLNRMAR